MSDDASSQDESSPIENYQQQYGLDFSHPDDAAQMAAFERHLNQATSRSWPDQRLAQRAVNTVVSMHAAQLYNNRVKRGDAGAFYAHPELNELAELTHQKREVEGDKRWLPDIGRYSD